MISLSLFVNNNIDGVAILIYFFFKSVSVLVKILFFNPTSYIKINIYLYSILSMSIYIGRIYY